MKLLEALPPRAAAAAHHVRDFLRHHLQRLRRPTRRECLWALAVPPAVFVLYLLVLVPLTPGIRDLRKAKIEQPAQILSADGRELALFKRSHREWVGLPSIAPSVVDALIATEDHRFYDHFGIDAWRLGGAMLRTFSGDRQGGSTLTQQLARNLYPEEIGRAPTLNRKLKEAVTALKIEALYTKDEILETYLNTVPFLYNAYGIEMAARTYFDKSARQLTVLEAATLVGMLKGTSYYNPVLNPERAVQRRNTVLAQMAKRGKLAPEQLAGLQKRPLRLDFERQEEPQGPAPHFAQQLRKWLIAWADSNGYNLYADGLVVHTTIDSRLQDWANQAVARQGRMLQGVANASWALRTNWSADAPLVQALVRETPEYRAALQSGQSPGQAMKALTAQRAFLQRLREDKTRVQAGLLALDPRSGEVRAWVGSRDYAQDPFDHVAQARRQPGSTFKPFVYGAALAQGARPGDQVLDQSVEIQLTGGEVWRPSDGGPASGQPMSLADGLAYSKNTVTAQVMQSVGPARVAQLARAMGVRQSPLLPVPALALGTSPVTLREMVSAYGTLAGGGLYREPQLVTRITDGNGRELARFAPQRGERVLPAGTDYALLDMLRGVVDKGTGSAIRSRWGIRADVAGKTGTTQDYADGWFILAHPQLVVGAWAGFNDSRITLRSSHWGQGAHSALPMVGDLTARALRARVIDPAAKFEPPDERRFYTPLVERVRGWRTRLLAWVQDRLRPAPAAKPPAPPAPAAPPPLPDTAPEPVPPASAPAVPEEVPAQPLTPLAPSTVPQWDQPPPPSGAWITEGAEPRAPQPPAPATPPAPVFAPPGA